MKNLQNQYRSQEDKIKAHYNNFEKLPEKDHFREFMFCILTPQSNAQRCWQAVEQISKLKSPTEKQINTILKTKTRFHNVKTLRILNAKKTYNKILPLLKNKNRIQLRNQLAKKVNGFGLKESSHFLRNIGKSDNQIAILDRHILSNLKKNNIIKDAKIKNDKNYLEIEQAFLKFSKSINIQADHLDIMWWSQENGELFK